MTWCNNNDDDAEDDELISSSPNQNTVIHLKNHQLQTVTCPSCGYHIEYQDQAGIHDLPGLPAGVKFDPSDQEIMEHLEAKVLSDHSHKLHPLIDQFIPTLEGENGICYTHPEKLPGVSKDGQIRHFFHRPSKAYTTGTRKRRKVHTDEEGNEKRWHKTGKTRPVFVNGAIKGFKKILVLYTNYGRQRKPEKTNWVMHQYHFGNSEEEKDGELVVSKVFYQTQPRQCGSNLVKDPIFYGKLKRSRNDQHEIPIMAKNAGFSEYYNQSFTNYEHSRENPPHELIPHLVQQANPVGSSLIRFGATGTSEGKLERKP